MGKFRILKAASFRIDEIYLYTHGKWGAKQAENYIQGLFAQFEAIAERKIQWKPIPAEFGVHGYFTKFEKHFIYWKELPTGEVGIASILHERMDLGNRLKDDVKTA